MFRPQPAAVFASHHQHVKCTVGVRAGNGSNFFESKSTINIKSGCIARRHHAKHDLAIADLERVAEGFAQVEAGYAATIHGHVHLQAGAVEPRKRRDGHQLAVPYAPDRAKILAPSQAYPLVDPRVEGLERVGDQDLT